MYTNSFSKELSRKQKEWEMRSWKYDIESFNRMTRLRELSIKAGRNTDFFDRMISDIKARWPNVKKW